jgi:uncharacterized membrane protein YhhN
MLPTVVLVSVTAGAVASLLWAIRVGDRVLEVISKCTASAAFVLLGVLRWQPGDSVGGWIVAGLALCAVGDACLLWKRSFDPGLLSFMLGHLAYIIEFSAALPLRQWPPVFGVALLAVGTLASRWLWPHLGRRRIPVLCYILVISVMVWGGAATFLLEALPWTAASGAVFFYASDLAVARQRFVRAEFINRALGLPSYYLGQLLLAVTIGAR